MITQEFYFGKHKLFSNERERYYLGSGVLIRLSRQKYRFHNFQKETLATTNCSLEAQRLERDLILAHRNNVKCLNGRNPARKAELEAMAPLTRSYRKDRKKRQFKGYRPGVIERRSQITKQLWDQGVYDNRQHQAHKTR